MPVWLEAGQTQADSLISKLRNSQLH